MAETAKLFAITLSGIKFPKIQTNMKTMIKSFAFGFAILLCASSSQATVTLQFGQTGVARASGFANSSSVPTNGLKWGIIVDGLGNGFGQGSYTAFDSTSTTGTFLAGSANATDDVYITTATAATNSATATGGDSAVAAGAITQLSSIFLTYPSNIAAGDVFRLVWFDTNASTVGNKYGMFSDPSFVLPPDGQTFSFASVFAGDTDSLKPANLTIAGVPEPSRVIFTGLGLLGLMLRRRRA